MTFSLGFKFEETGSLPGILMHRDMLPCEAAYFNYRGQPMEENNRGLNFGATEGFPGVMIGLGVSL